MNKKRKKESTKRIPTHPVSPFTKERKTERIHVLSTY